MNLSETWPFRVGQRIMNVYADTGAYMLICISLVPTTWSLLLVLLSTPFGLNNLSLMGQLSS